MSNLQNCEVFAGEDRTLTLYARDSLNAPANLAGKSVLWRAGRGPCNPDALTPILIKTGTVTDATNGIFTVPILATDTACMDGDYAHLAATTDAQQLQAVVTVGRLRVLPYIRSS